MRSIEQVKIYYRALVYKPHSTPAPVNLSLMQPMPSDPIRHVYKAFE